MWYVHHLPESLKEVITDKASPAPAFADSPRSFVGETYRACADHNKKGDVWVVLYGRILNISNLLSLHPGSKWAFLTFGGKDAAADFGMIHPLDVVEKYAPDAIFGFLFRGKPKKAN